MTTQNRIATLASQSHDEWRAPRLLQNGTYEPRVKNVKDQAWIAAHSGLTTCDIANTDYANLPEEWQAENKISARFAVELVEAQLQAGQPLDAAFIEHASDFLHDKWVERNGSWADPSLTVPYSQLPEDEKEKDRIFVRKAIAVCR